MQTNWFTTGQGKASPKLTGVQPTRAPTSRMGTLVFVEGAAYRTPDGMHVHGGPPRSSPDAPEAALRSSFG
jgi:hypothetical protein